MKQLIDRRFILVFDSGVIAIKHHRINNNFRSDRKKPTAYLNELSQLYLKDNNSYTDNPNNGVLVVTTKCQPTDNQVTTKCPPNITKHNITKHNRTERNGNGAEPALNGGGMDDFRTWWDRYPRKSGSIKDAFRAYMDAGISIEVLNDSLDEHISSEEWSRDSGRFIPGPVKFIENRLWNEKLHPKGGYRQRVPTLNLDDITIDMG